MSIVELNIMPVHLEPALRNDHNVFQVEIQDQVMKTEKRKRLRATLDNQPQFILSERYAFKKSHFEKILKGVIVVLPIGCYFLFKMSGAVFLSGDLEGV